MKKLLFLYFIIFSGCANPLSLPFEINNPKSIGVGACFTTAGLIGVYYCYQLIKEDNANAYDIKQLKETMKNKGGEIKEWSTYKWNGRCDHIRIEISKTCSKENKESIQEDFGKLQSKLRYFKNDLLLSWIAPFSGLSLLIGAICMRDGIQKK